MEDTFVLKCMRGLINPYNLLGHDSMIHKFSLIGKDYYYDTYDVFANPLRFIFARSLYSGRICVSKIDPWSIRHYLITASFDVNGFLKALAYIKKHPLKYDQLYKVAVKPFDN